MGEGEKVDVKNVRIHLTDNDGSHIDGNACFDPVKEVVNLSYNEDDEPEEEKMSQIPYSSILYWSILKQIDGDTDDEDEKNTEKEVSKIPNINFFRKMFGNK